MKSIQINVLKYINDDTNAEENYQNLIKSLDEFKIRENKHDIKAFSHLILNIANNYHRKSTFFNKIDKMISVFQKEIKEYFSNYEIFNIFKSNKRILLFLFEEKIIIPDVSIAHTLMKNKYKEASYHYYFYPEFKAFFDNNLLIEMHEVNQTLFENNEIADIEKFKQNRKTGENENEICHLMREDMIDEFIDYLRNNKIITSSQIDQSIFETSPFLINKKISLIEYAAFFGSFKIFKFIYLSDIKLNPSLWLYAIHGQSYDIIHVLKEKYIRPEDRSYQECLFESIKCHHLEMTNKFLRAKRLQDVNFDYQSLKYYNFEFFPIDINTQDYIFFDFTKFDYYTIVDLLMKTIDIDINDIKIFTDFFFNTISNDFFYLMMF